MSINNIISTLQLYNLHNVLYVIYLMGAARSCAARCTLMSSCPPCTHAILCCAPAPAPRCAAALMRSCVPVLMRCTLLRSWATGLLGYCATVLLCSCATGLLHAPAPVPLRPCAATFMHSCEPPPPCTAPRPFFRGTSLEYA